MKPNATLEFLFMQGGGTEIHGEYMIIVGVFGLESTMGTMMSLFLHFNWPWERRLVVDGRYLVGGKLLVRDFGGRFLVGVVGEITLKHYGGKPTL